MRAVLSAGAMTCLLIAATEMAYVEIVNVLLECHDLDLNQHGGNSGSTLLMNAIANRLPYSTLKALLVAGADVNMADKDGDTALIVATLCGYDEALRLLLENGADITHIAKGGSVLEVALAHSREAREEEDSDAEEAYEKCLEVLVPQISKVFK